MIVSRAERKSGKQTNANRSYVIHVQNDSVSLSNVGLDRSKEFLSSFGQKLETDMRKCKNL